MFQEIELDVEGVPDKCREQEPGHQDGGSEQGTWPQEKDLEDIKEIIQKKLYMDLIMNITHDLFNDLNLWSRINVNWNVMWSTLLLITCTWLQQ